MTIEERTERLERYSPPAEPVTLTARCETGVHRLCRGLVFSMTGNGPCKCACHQEKESNDG